MIANVEGWWSGGAGEGGWVGQHPHRGKGEAGEVGCGRGICGGVAGKWDII